MKWYEKSMNKIALAWSDHRPVTGRLRVVRIGGGLVMGGRGYVRVLGRDLLDNLVCGTSVC